MWEWVQRREHGWCIWKTTESPQQWGELCRLGEQKGVGSGRWGGSSMAGLTGAFSWLFGDKKPLGGSRMEVVGSDLTFPRISLRLDSKRTGQALGDKLGATPSLRKCKNPASQGQSEQRLHNRKQGE